MAGTLVFIDAYVDFVDFVDFVCLVFVVVVWGFCLFGFVLFWSFLGCFLVNFLFKHLLRKDISPEVLEGLRMNFLRTSVPLMCIISFLSSLHDRCQNKSKPQKSCIGIRWNITAESNKTFIN